MSTEEKNVVQMKEEEYEEEFEPDINHAKIYHNSILKAQKNPNYKKSIASTQVETTTVFKITFPLNKQVELLVEPNSSLGDLKAKVDDLLVYHGDYSLEIPYPRETILSSKSQLNRKIKDLKLGKRIALVFKPLNINSEDINSQRYLKEDVKLIDVSSTITSSLKEEKEEIKNKPSGKKLKGIPKWLKLSKK